MKIFVMLILQQKNNSARWAGKKFKRHVIIIFRGKYYKWEMQYKIKYF